MPTNIKVYQPLSNIATLGSLPDSLDFIKNALDAIFSKIYYKDFQSSVSNNGSVAFYSLKIVTKERIETELIFGLKFILNRDFDDDGISSFPVTVNYNWPIIAYLKQFDLQNFSFSPRDFYEMGLIVFNISEENVLNNAISVFVPADSQNPINKLVDDLNEALEDILPSPIPYPVTENKLAELSVAIKELYGEFASTAVFIAYILAGSDLSAAKEKLNDFFKSFVPDNIEDYLLNLIKPEAKITLELSASIEFPRNILVPWQEVNGVLTRIEDENIKSYFDFAKATLYADTKAGIGYNLELSGTLNPGPAEIGRTGILLEIESLKLDLSKKTNIPEAIADGRPDDFTGVYARALTVTLPARWFQDDAVQGTPSTGLRIGGYDLLIGTGGISGTFMLEAIPIAISSPDPYYFEDKFEFIYPVTLFQKDPATEAITEIQVHNITQLKQKLFPNSTTIPAYPFVFPLSVKSPPVTGIVNTFENITDYQLFVNSFAPTGVTDTVPTLWKKVGGDSGFRVGFNKFDITFKQNKVTSSNIKGALEIKKFVYPGTSTPVHIDIEGHLTDDGDFNLTASAQPPYPIELEDVFTYNLKSVELGKEDELFYIGTAGTLQFEGFLKETMGLGPIEIERLRIYSDGSIEFKGGSLQLVKPIVLKLGPVEITVSAIHYGSHQQEYDGVMRKFNYFGFDGGISVDPLGVEIRGDGVKFYYCVDSLPNKPHAYLHIQTLYLDLTIPAKSPVAIINGWLSIPEPGVSKEYAGGIKIQIPKAKIAGSADMKLMPKYPAFIIDAEIDLPVPIPLGTFAIYGFRGLLGYRYVAEKEAIGLVSGVNTWYEYYKAPQRGINVRKFNGPDKTKGDDKPISIGAGASLGTSADNGTVLNIKAFVLLSIPSLFMIDGRAAILSARLGLEDTKDPPFFAFVAVGDDSLEFGFGADFKMPTKTGALLAVYADIELGFFFKHQHPWYVNVGTDINPVTAKIISLLTIKSYVMLSAKGIKAGARGEFNFDRNYGVIKVKAHAFIEIGGQISFERPQIGAYLMAGVDASIKVLFIRLDLEIGIMFGVEAPKPFLLYGKFHFKIRIRVWRVTLFKFSGDLEVVWNINKNVDRKPINPMISADNFAAIPQLVKGVNMLSNEIFLLGQLDEEPTVEQEPGDKILNHIIPLDTYIDIKTEKGLLPGNVDNPDDKVRKLIGGVNNPAQQYVDLIPPVSSIKGRDIRQVKHQYRIEDISIKFWNGLNWEDYHPYQALYPTESSSAFANLKIGQFQKTDGQYNTVRLLATTPFSYTEQGQAGWYVPEQYGLTATTLFCEGQSIDHKCANFLYKPLNAHYYCGNANMLLYSNQAAFQLLGLNDNDFAYITNEANPHSFAKSLAFDNWNSMQITLPSPSVEISLKLSNYTDGVKVKFYSIIQTPENDELFNVVYGNPNPLAANLYEPYVMEVSAVDLANPIQYNHNNWTIINQDWRAVTRIIIEPLYDSTISQQIAVLNEQISDIENDNNLIALGLIPGEVQSVDALEAQLHALTCGSVAGIPGTFINRYTKKDKLNYYYSKEFTENGENFIYAIGTTKNLGLITKLNPNGSIVWEKVYDIGKSESPLIFKHIIQMKYPPGSKEVMQYVIHATSGYENYLVSFSYEEGEILWINHIEWDDKDVVINIDPCYNEFAFFMTISDRNEIDTHKEPLVLKIDKLCNVIKATFLAIKEEEFIVNAIDSDAKGIVAAGRFLQGSKQESRGAIISLSDVLNITEALYISSPDTTIHDIKILPNGDYMVAGYDSKSNCIFVSAINGEGANVAYRFLDSQNHHSLLQLAGNVFYVLIHNDSNGMLYQLNYDYSANWIKEIQLVSGTNGIRNFTYNETSGKITLNCYNQTEGSLVVHTDGEFESCLTAALQRTLIRGSVDVKRLSTDRKDGGLPFKAVNWNKADINSNIKEYCPSGCGEENANVCELYNSIMNIFQYSIVDPNTAGDIDYGEQTGYFAQIEELIYGSGEVYELIKEHLEDEFKVIDEFLKVIDGSTYIIAWNAVMSILDYLNDLGNCVCECGDKAFTMLHEVCWMALEDYEYNINIPNQEAITADAQAAIDGITQYIQPIWRPDTNYYVHFVLRDIVDNVTVNPNLYPFTYGFTTAGPVGYFHTHDKSDYGDTSLKTGDRLLKQDNSFYAVHNDGLYDVHDNGGPDTLYISNSGGFIYEETTGTLRNAASGNLIMIPGSDPAKPLKVVSHADKYALTSLRQYIDYERSYPNADGNLLSAKPLFYNDEIANTTQICLYYSKAYATHFFTTWGYYKGKNPVAGRLKIVIKDPVENILITNPPSLDYNPLITDIPQTQEVWNVDENPQVPFAVSHYFNMMEADNCIGEVIITKPASKFTTIIPKNLKPDKLYTAIVNNLYDVNHNGALENTVEETREVHKFIFKTSRYKDFKAQVRSFYLEEMIQGELASREAIFVYKKGLTVDEIDAAYSTILGQPISGLTPQVITTLTNDYQHPYDRVFEGILGFKPWDEPISTEINIIRNENDNMIIALIVRNPEPFNNPKFPQVVIKGNLQPVPDPAHDVHGILEVMNGLDPDLSYSVLFSKDNSQAIIMNTARNISGSLDLNFHYKNYFNTLPGNDPKINYPIATSEVLSVNLSNH
jgi:hypothetical protein